MNLARVEHYLADYLSVLESRRQGVGGKPQSEPIALHAVKAGLPSAGDGRLVPPTIKVAPNVYLIGTVNIDETTHPFSRKVLDRANVVELFDVDLTRKGPDSTASITNTERGLVRAHFTREGSFLDLTEPSLDTPWLSELVAINAVLAHDRMHFGYRVRNEVLSFVSQAGDGARLLGQGEAEDRSPSTSKSSRRCCRNSPVLESASSARFADYWTSRWLPLHGTMTGRDASLKILNGCSPGWRKSQAATAGRPSSRQRPRARRHPPVPAAEEDAADAEGDVAADGAAAVSSTNPWPLFAHEVRYPRSARKIARMLLQLRDEGYSSFFE